MVVRARAEPQNLRITPAPTRPVQAPPPRPGAEPLDIGPVVVVRAVVPAKGEVDLPPQLAQETRILVAPRAALDVAGRLVPPLTPIVLAAGAPTVRNPKADPALFFVLSCDPTVALFGIGSRVRGTQHAGSDLDLLAIARGAERQEVQLGRVSLTITPRKVFMDQARAGAPFVASVLDCHLHLAGPGEVMARARAQFGRAPALPEPAHLADLIRFCLGRPALEGGRMLALARLRWALRTLLFLDGEDPFAAPAALAPATRALLDRLAAVHRGVPGALPELARAAAARIAPLARLAEDAAPAAARAHFAATGNLLGLEVVEAIDLHRARTRRAAPAGAV